MCCLESFKRVTSRYYKGNEVRERVKLQNGVSTESVVLLYWAVNHMAVFSTPKSHCVHRSSPGVDDAVGARVRLASVIFAGEEVAFGESCPMWDTGSD